MNDYESPHDRIYPETFKAFGSLLIHSEDLSLRGKTITITRENFPQYVYYAQFRYYRNNPNDIVKADFYHVACGNYIVTVEKEEGEKHISITSDNTAMEWGYV